MVRESDTRSSLRATFAVTPQGADSRPHIPSAWDGGAAIGGFIERPSTPPVMHAICAAELDRLNAYVRKQAAAASRW